MAKKDEKKLSRRGFLKTTVCSMAVVTPTLGQQISFPKETEKVESLVQESVVKKTKTADLDEYDFSKKSAACQADEVIKSACQFCNSLCGLNIYTKEGRVIDITGEKNDPVQAGGICVKGSMMSQLVYNRFRLKQPMKRVSGEKGSVDSKFVAISWEEALTIIADKFIELRDKGQAHLIANKTSGRLPRGVGSLINRFFSMIGSPNDTDVGPVCNDAGGNALNLTFGLGNFTNGYGIDGSTEKEDLGSSKYLLFLGTNQAETHPVTFSYLLRRRTETGAKLVVLDPRMTPTAAQADDWIAPKPHTDLAFVLGMLTHIIKQNLYDTKFVEKWVLGFEQLKEHLTKNNYTIEWAEKVTGVPASKIKEVAEGYATSKPSAIFCNAGISHQLNAFATYRVLTFLAAITGNIGIAGGGCNFMHNTWPGDLRLPEIKGTLPRKEIALPVGPDYFAESILTAKPYQLKAIMIEGNPLVGCANTNKVTEAFRKLDFLVYTGLFMEETAYFADVLLPVCSGLEMETVYMRRDDRAIRWQKQAVKRAGESKPDWEIWIDLAHVMAKQDRKNAKEYWTNNFPLEWKDYRKLWAEFVKYTPAMGGMTAERLEKRVEPLRWPCPKLEHPGVSTLYLEHSSWYEAVEALDKKNKGKRFLTPSGKVEIYTEEIDKSLATAGHSALPVFYTHPEVTGQNTTIEYTDEFVKNPINPQALTRKVKIGIKSSGSIHEKYPLMGMTGRASVVHFASMTHWTYTGKQLNGIRLVQIHPKTASSRGIKNHDQVKVESPRGSIIGTALIWEEIREDTIYIPNGFGMMQKMAEEFEVPFYESTNSLLDDSYYDNLSGQQAYKCFACNVKKYINL